MPAKKSNLNNASSKGSRRKRVERAQQLPEQIETRNAAERIRTAESRAQESQEQRDERRQQNITRTRAARERNIATSYSTSTRSTKATDQPLINTCIIRSACL
ncbi:hypothetical protein Zmor_004583 [Zophobas morio]|uniref:Uncharacterized protein n=1 Tax=Zophobas morio TaxID=2755281 RepID=A0AA38MLG8_9CUCU|nr:hypothetical protein Zmor_004583 [Zophobas morio]